MTIWMISREVETETGNGSLYDDYVEEEFGYFSTKKEAEGRVFELQQGERESYERRWREGTHASWLARKEQRDRIRANNAILVEHGGVAIDVPHLWAEPVMKPWETAMSSYKVVEVQPG